MYDWLFYSSDTVAPRASKVFFSFSASSFGRLSLRVLGTDSTNFLACVRQYEVDYDIGMRVCVARDGGTSEFVGKGQDNDRSA